MYIYCITNLVNDKKYVGQTIRDPDVRWYEHKYNANNDCVYYIHRSMRKYGSTNFQFEVIDESTNNIDELNDLEEFYISFYDTFKGHGYNLTSGGDSFVMSEETKEKLKQVHLGKKLTDEHRQKLSESQIGRKHSKETRQRMVESRKNIILSEDSKRKIWEANLGKTGFQSGSSKKIIQIDKNTGMEIACWFSTRCAAIFIGKNLTSGISKVCKNQRKTAGGFIWRYVDAC